MTARRKTPAKRKSGANIPNSQRHTVQVQLRLSPDVASALRALAAREDESVSAYVACLVTGAMSDLFIRAMREPAFEVELDSPPFVPDVTAEFEARGFERRHRR